MTPATFARGDRPPTWPPPALDPAGPFASPLAEISWVVLIGGGLVLAMVLVVLGVAVSRPPGWLRHNGTIVILGLAVPVVVLTAALGYGLATTSRLNDPPPADAMRIRVVGEMWWWRVMYFEGDAVVFETANEIRIPTSRSVTVELESADVIHSFWAPRLGAKLDMIPGRRNILRLEAKDAGVYQGHCTEFCGLAHALMAFEVIAMDPSAFDIWRAQQTAPAARVASAGAALFDDAGCSACHAVRGAGAEGRAGPDLTHVASRRRLGGGILANDPPTLRRWIKNAHALKPGVRMPAYDTLTPADREAIAVYLEGLK